MKPSREAQKTRTSAPIHDSIDRILLAPVFGPLFFLVVMWLVFQLTTTLASPLQKWLSTLLTGPVAGGTSALMNTIGLGGTWMEGLVVDGLIAGVGMVLTFLPMMTMMFLLLAGLEHSGYLARAAVLTDRVMGILGLPGQAFLPLVVGFGCNVPALMATRDLPQRHQRLMTALLIPFTACSARLTVFIMLGSMFFGRWAGTVVFGMYLVSLGYVVLAGLLMRKTLWRTIGEQPLVFDLPAYQIPRFQPIWFIAWARIKDFLQTAGGIIVAAVIGVWFLQAIPVHGGSFGHVEVTDSLYGWSASLVAPLFSPAGFGNWEAVAALVVGLVAKEAVISSWAQTYGVLGVDLSVLGDHIWMTFEVSSGGHAIAAIVAFMVYLLAYTPCVATFATQVRQVGWKWTAVGMAIQLVMASIAAIVTFQFLRLIL
ncbi:MAG: ferrous iron transporter B [Propionibacteriaceae bacterium]|nr:ferrous iron transporter B [Propionibacteriaceae bacterium]